MLTFNDLQGLHYDMRVLNAPDAECPGSGSEAHRLTSPYMSLWITIDPQKGRVLSIAVNEESASQHDLCVLGDYRDFEASVNGMPRNPNLVALLTGRRPPSLVDTYDYRNLQTATKFSPAFGRYGELVGCSIRGLAGFSMITVRAGSASATVQNSEKCIDDPVAARAFAEAYAGDGPVCTVAG